MNRQAQAVVLLLLGGAVLRASLTDLHLRYVKAGLQPFLVASGLLLLAAAAMTLWYELRPDAEGDDHDDHDGHGHHEPRVGWLLMLPVVGLLLVAPPALGSYAAGQAGTVLPSQETSDYPPLPAGDPVRTTVLDYASRALFDRGRSIGDRRVQLTGFVATGPDGQPILARMILSCCAADGRPVKLGLSGDVPTGLADDTWIEVTGRYTDRIGRDPVNDAEVPYLEVESWRPVPTPKQQYE
ncbi:TIGR03943 family putative permease subunit [Micromonospora cathayae]|uniref:TIGR03943 family protein n=1 Tax=Micromonospora cathayae TaxID=3028804 RepID=A0ABY7ZPR2_9ACTN|nr:TIGR03943 family protein [Micromonospora sp. HUAS 3]WDZ84766.1 TIGR03943 family protein [Micromonospora sp. HUAS 3]